MALGQGAVMVFGGILALLVAQLFGKDTETDAFFAAYGLYSLGITFTQTFRLTAVARLVKGGDEAISLMLGAVALLCLVLAVPMILVAGPLGRLLVDTDPSGTASSTLRILWVALAAQLLASMVATVLAVRGRFKAIGMATLAVGLVSLATFLLTQAALGIEAAAFGLAAGSLTLVAALVGVLVRTGWRPPWPDRGAVGAMAGAAGRLIAASAMFLGNTLSYVICVAVAARQGPGEATLFAYGYVLAVMILAVTANVAAMVRSPGIMTSADRTAAAERTGLWSFRFTLILAGPVLALALVAGEPVIGLALGSGFSDADVRSILVLVVLLVGWLLASAAAVFAIVDLLARGALGRLAVLAVVQVGALAMAALAGARLAGTEGIAAALSLVTLAAAMVQLRWAYGDAWRAAAAAMARAAGGELALVSVVVAPSAVLLLAAGRTATTTVAAAGLTVVLAAAATWIWWPRESRSLISLLVRRTVPTERGPSDPCTTLPSP